MTAVTVVGVGSPQGADRFGWQVIEYLENESRLGDLAPGRIRLVASDRPGMALLDLIADARLALLVDAIDGGEAGRVVRLDKQQLLVNFANLSSHSFGVAEALALGEAIDMLPPYITLYGVETGERPLTLTPPRQAIVTVARLIRQQIRQRLDSLELPTDEPVTAATR
jgi:hydrogenase maturation protease